MKRRQKSKHNIGFPEDKIIVLFFRLVQMEGGYVGRAVVPSSEMRLLREMERSISITDNTTVRYDIK